jgi:hypothetical protein
MHQVETRDDGQQPRQEEDEFFMDLRDLTNTIFRHGAATVAYELVKHHPELAEAMAYELTVSIKQYKRLYRR